MHQKKRLLDYIIWKLITNLKNDFRIMLSRILQREYFGNTKIYESKRRRYGGAGRNIPAETMFTLNVQHHFQ